MQSRTLCFAASIVAVLVSSACSGGNEAALVAEELAPIEEAEQQPAGVEKVFEDRYSENGTIQVYENARGLTLLVKGAIGVDDARTIAGAGSLENLFRTVHPELDRLPLEVEELSARLEAQRGDAELPAREVDEADVIDETDAVDQIPAPAATLDKSRSFFDSTICTSWFDSNLGMNFVKEDCKYSFVFSSGSLNLNYPLQSRVSFTYNDNSTGTTRTRLWFRNNPTAHASLFLGAGLWGYASWPDYGPEYSVRAGLHDVASGNIGITRHLLTPPPPR